MRKKAAIRTITAGMAVLLAALSFSACGSGSSAKSVSGEAAETPAAATDSDAKIVAVSPDGPLFPSLDLVVPTTEAAPEYIRIGTQSWIVADLQRRLMELGFMDNDEPTDYYGEVTENAVKIYQRQNNLPQDGIVGQDTLKAIMDENAKKYAAKKGDVGTDISKLQERLYQLGYLAAESQVTGTFDDATEVAVQKFQQMNSVDADGTVGTKTMNLVYAEDVKPNMLTYGEKSDVVLAAQNRLFELGYLTSTPDGTFGLATVMAIKEFQARNNQVVDGFLGPGTREALNNTNAQPFGLRLGDQSDTVTEVQKLLNHWGYLDADLITGYYGDATRTAVVDFQGRNDLTDDGSVGAATMAKLTSDNVLKAAPKPAPTTAAKKKNGTSVTKPASNGQGNTEAPGKGNTSSGQTRTSTPAYSGGGSVGNLLSVAASKLGTPYVWGAKGPTAFDCSGFVYWCLNQAGVSQSYMTSGGWASSGRGQRISSFGDLQAGDIIVENGHVGICAGDGTVYDASSSNGEVVHRDLSSWWANNFVCGYRIF